MKLRQFTVRFHEHNKPYLVKATDISAAHKQANWLAKKYQWNVASVGAL